MEPVQTKIREKKDKGDIKEPKHVRRKERGEDLGRIKEK